MPQKAFASEAAPRRLAPTQKVYLRSCLLYTSDAADE